MRRLLLSLLLLLTALGHAEPVRITVLQLNDVYTIGPVDKGKSAGFDRVETLRQRFLQENPNTVFVMSGDTLSPSVASNFFQGEQMIAGWNAVKLDIATLGNHEFDFGDQVLLKRMGESRFTWLGSNVFDRTTGKLFGGMPATVTRDIGGVKVGFFGLCTVDTATTSKASANVEFRPVVPVAREMVSRLKAEGAQVIVAVTHLGIQEDRELAAKVEGIDVICGGHEHTLIEQLVGDVPIFKWGSDARLFGKIDLIYDQGKVQWIEWAGIPIDDKVPGDPAVAALIKSYEDKIAAAIGQPIGSTAVPLDGLSKSNRQFETNLGDFIADSYRARLEADVALINGGSVRVNAIVPAGVLTRRDILSILPFENPVVKLEVPGKTLREAFEHGFSRVGVMDEFGAFPQIGGMRVRYDASRPVGSRVVELTVGGQPVEDSRVYTLATTTFVADGGDGYAMFKDLKRLVSAEEGPVEAQILVDAIQKAGTISPGTDGRIERVDKP